MYRELFAHTGLSLERLRAFGEVAAAGGMAKAAPGDPIRQSQLSRQIHDLEVFFEVALTAKKGRTLVLTPAGEKLAVVVREVFTQLSDFQRAQHTKSMEITLGAGESIFQWLVLPQIQEIKRRLPSVVLSLRNLRTSAVLTALQEGSLDIGVLRSDAIPKELRGQPLGTLRYKIFVPARLTAGRQPFRWAEALKLPFVGLEGEGRLMVKLRQAAKSMDVALRIELLCSSLPAVAASLAKIDAATVLPAFGLTEAAQGELRAVDAPFLREFDSPLSLVWNPRHANVRPSTDLARTELTKALRFK
jgi:DNA-binding transcriptional LysR family regulator